MTVEPHADPFQVATARGVREAGPGPAQPRLHRLPASMRPWAEHLAAHGYAVSVPLLPGHGTTWQDMNTTHLGRLVRRGRARLRRALAEQRGPVFVCGLSMGGGLALRLAADQPDRVAGLVLVNPAVHIDRWTSSCCRSSSTWSQRCAESRATTSRSSRSSRSTATSGLRCGPPTRCSGLQRCCARDLGRVTSPAADVPLGRGPRRGPLLGPDHPGPDRLDRRRGAAAARAASTSRRWTTTLQQIFSESADFIARLRDEPA